jgi:hypothetical protein
MRIAFLYNAQDHHILHSLPIACTLSAGHPEIEVVVLARQARQLDLARRLAAYYPGHRLGFEMLQPPPFASRLAGVKRLLKFASLLANRRRLDRFDALVVPERTSLLAKRIGVTRPRYILSFHGSGGHDSPDDPRLRRFDLLLVPNQGRLARIAAAGNLRPGRATVIGSTKLDLVRRMDEARPALFANRRPTILYNPHHRPGTTSWTEIGQQLLDHFAGRDDYNLIFAPHVRLFDPPALHAEAFRRYQGLDHIRIDLGSEASIDMSYTLAADIYLGDISSQVLEFLVRPRPCLFLNPRRLEWRDNEDFAYWRLGPVVGTIDEMAAALASRDSWQPAFEPAQREAFAAAFPSLDRPAPEIAAHAIAAFLREGAREPG